MPATLTSCQSCGQPAELRTCSKCSVTAVVIDCGHFEQPAMIAAGVTGPPVCGSCADLDAAEAAVTSAEEIAAAAAENTRQARRDLDAARAAYEAACDAEADAYLAATRNG